MSNEYNINQLSVFIIFYKINIIRIIPTIN